MPDNALSHSLNTDPYQRRLFFEDMAAGALSPEQMAEGMKLLGMDRPGHSCAVAVFTIPPEPRQPSDFFSEPAVVRGTLMAHFLKYSEYIAFPWGPAAYAAVICAQTAQMPNLIERCVDCVRTAYGRAALPIPWYVAVSEPAEGSGHLPALLREAARLWAARYFRPEQHVLRGPLALPSGEPASGSGLRRLDPRLADMSVVRAFLERGWAEEIPIFADWYVQTALGGARSRPLRHYGIVSSLLAARQYALTQGLSDEAAGEVFAPLEPADWDHADLRSFLVELLGRALSLRADSGGLSARSAFSLALDHIDRHFTAPDLSLETTARAADMNPAYLSALFRRRLDTTFTEYVTRRRMEAAKALLQATDRQPGQIARAVGYRDTHYFSTVFKKTQGCTPSAFRAQRKRAMPP